VKKSHPLVQRAWQQEISGLGVSIEPAVFITYTSTNSTRDDTGAEKIIGDIQRSRFQPLIQEI
jgi:hypothetical protein